jgi:hypothetical protein
MRLVQRKTGAAQNDGVAVAFVAQGVSGGVLGLKIGEHEIALEDGRINGAVRAIRAGTAGGRAGIAVVAVGAINLAGHHPRRDEAGHVDLITSDGFNRMKILVGGGKLQPCVGLDLLARHGRRTEEAAAGAIKVLKIGRCRIDSNELS